MVVRSAFLENPCVWTVTVRVNRICRCVCVSAVPRLLAPARDGEKIVWRDALATVRLVVSCGPASPVLYRVNCKLYSCTVMM